MVAAEARGVRSQGLLMGGGANGARALAKALMGEPPTTPERASSAGSRSSSSSTGAALLRSLLGGPDLAPSAAPPPPPTPPPPDLSGASEVGTPAAMAAALAGPLSPGNANGAVESSLL